MRRISVCLLLLATALAAVGIGVGTASGQGGSASALGFGTFSSGGRNQFFFNASTSTNGSGGSGTIAVFDPAAHVYYNANVTCLFVGSSGKATIWGTVTSANTAPPYVGWSVLLNVTPGTDSGAGFGNYSFRHAAPTTCGAVTKPNPDPIAAGLIQTTGGGSV